MNEKGFTLVELLVLLLIPLILAAVICMPLCVIWGLNTLFALAIPYTFKTWAAALVLLIAVNGVSLSSKKKKE